MAKELIKQIDEFTNLYRDTKSGIAWVTNGRTGGCHSAHPNIDASGSARGMKNLGYWKYNALVKRSHGTIYNVSVCSIHDELDEIARQHCDCGGNHG